MVKYLLIIFLIHNIYANESINLNQNIIQQAGIEILDISSVKKANIISKSKKSLIILSKIKLKEDIKKYKIFDIYDSHENFTNDQRNLIAILIITDEHIDILSEWICNSCSSAMNNFYQDSLRLISADSIPELFSHKIFKKQQGIIIPTEASIDMYIFWDGFKYELVTKDEIP